MELAIREGRILLTEDKDFGQLVHANQAATGGVFLLRFPARARANLPGAVVKLVEQRGEGLLGRFVDEDPFCTTSLGDFGQRDAMGNSGVATRTRHPGNTVI